MKRRLRSVLVSLPLIVCVALGARLYFAWSYTAHNPHRALAAAPFLFESGNIAHAIAAGEGFASPFRVPTGPTAWMTPIYPLLIAGIFRVFGAYTYPAFLAAIGINIAAGALTCWPLYRLGRAMAGSSAAALAAWLWALFPNALLLSVESIWDACLAALCATLLVWGAVELSRGRGWTGWCGFGLLCGFTLMLNPTVGILGFLPALWAAWRAGQWRRAAACAILALLCCVPWTVRNYRVFHAFVPLRSILGLQLWMGNSELAKDVWLGEGHPIRDTAEREKYIEMGEIAYMRAKRNLALAYMAGHPAREAQLIGWRFLAFWTGGTPHPLRFLGEDHTLWSMYVFVFNVLAAVLAGVGVVALARGGNPYVLAAAVMPALYPVAYYLTLALPRYRLPIDPLVLLLAAVAVLSVRRGDQVLAMPCPSTMS